MEKKTKVQIFAQILESYPLTEEESKFLNHEIEMLTRKAESKKKNYANSEKNQARMTYADEIYDAMESGKKYSYSDIRKLVPEIEGYTPQKLTGIVSILEDKNLITRERKGNANYFMRA